MGGKSKSSSATTSTTETNTNYANLQGIEGPASANNSNTDVIDNTGLLFGRKSSNNSVNTYTVDGGAIESAGRTSANSMMFADSVVRSALNNNLANNKLNHETINKTIGLGLDSIKSSSSALTSGIRSNNDLVRSVNSSMKDISSQSLDIASKITMESLSLQKSVNDDAMLQARIVAQDITKDAFDFAANATLSDGGKNSEIAKYAIVGAAIMASIPLISRFVK